MKVLRFVAQFEKLAHDLRRELGLTPGSEADLARSRAEALRGEVDLEALMARGREARLAAEHRRALEAETAAEEDGGKGPTCVGAVGDAGQVDAAGSRGSSAPAPRSPDPAAQ